ncbi:unnamed protein product, partial [Didymodactylos carnosus]
HSFFAYSGESLTQRLRSVMFSIILKQEVAWFDQQENNTGKLCALLQTDVANIQRVSMETIRNIRTVVQLTKENEFANKFSSFIHKSHRTNLNRLHLIGVLNGLMVLEYLGLLELLPLNNTVLVPWP